MARYALVNEENVVENLVEWDGKEYFPVQGELIQLAEDAPVEIGNVYKDGQFSKPELGKQSKTENKSSGK